MTTPSDRPEAQDGPFVAENGLEYLSKADRLLGRPIDCYRNWKILHLRQTYRARPDLAEKHVREWVAFHDAPAQDSDWGAVESFDVIT